MEKRKLQSMVDYCQSLKEEIKDCKLNEEWVILSKVIKYSDFVSMPLTLGMFVPTDEDGNILGEICCAECLDAHDLECIVKKDALSRVIFKGAEIVKTTGESFELIINERQICYYKAIPDYFIWNFKTIESLVKLNLELTLSAITKYQI